METSVIQLIILTLFISLLLLIGIKISAFTKEKLAELFQIYKDREHFALANYGEPVNGTHDATRKIDQTCGSLDYGCFNKFSIDLSCADGSDVKNHKVELYISPIWDSKNYTFKEFNK